MRSGRSRSSLDVLDDPLAAADEEKKKRGHVLSYLTMEESKLLSVDAIIGPEFPELVRKLDTTDPQRVPPEVIATKVKRHTFRFHFNTSSKLREVDFTLEDVLDEATNVDIQSFAKRYYTVILPSLESTTLKDARKIVVSSETRTISTKRCSELSSVDSFRYPSWKNHALLSHILKSDVKNTDRDYSNLISIISRNDWFLYINLSPDDDSPDTYTSYFDVFCLFALFSPKDEHHHEDRPDLFCKRQKIYKQFVVPESSQLHLESQPD
ncbi:hypothetical protein Tco_1315443 [Tanacetum coccineum]